jgi:hypothetical protein
MKMCGHCGETKDLSCFSPTKHQVGGYASWCRQCHNIAVSRRAKICKEQYETTAKIYRDANKEKIGIRINEWRDSNKEQVKQVNAKWNTDNKEHKKQYSVQWRKDNPHKVAMNNAKRRAAKLQATPRWLTKAQLEEIEWFYETAKELQWLSEEPLEVDHIEALQGERASGLHVPWNLQILPRKKNRSKGNR